jgi:MoaD family protein, archaeal
MNGGMQLVHVRFFGMTRIILRVSSVEIDAESVDEMLKKISVMYDGVELKYLKNCIVFVNGTNIIHLNLYKTKLKDGDEVQLFSPAAGG